MKNFYLLRMWVEGGAAREDLAFLFGTLAEVQLILEDILWSDCRTGMGLTYGDGRFVRFASFIDGEFRQDIDMIPLLTVRGPDGVTFGLDAASQPVGVDRDVVCEEEYLQASTVSPDWSRAPVVELPDPRLTPGGTVSVAELPDGREVSEHTSPLKWGMNDLEGSMDGDVTGWNFLTWLGEDIAVRPGWLSESVVGLARACDGPGNVDVLPALADALEDAGCDNHLFLTHCRQPPTAHAHGSWLAKLLLTYAAGRGPWLTDTTPNHGV